jgi:hypothetical protein
MANATTQKFNTNFTSTIHDFSENYKCCDSNKIKSNYLNKEWKISIHIPVNNSLACDNQRVQCYSHTQLGHEAGENELEY